MAGETRRIPLLRDRHTHPYFYAALEDGVNLRDEDAAARLAPAERRERAVGRIRARAAQNAGGWVIAHGWNNGQYTLSAADFDDLSAPVVVFNLSLHTLLVNAAGRALLHQAAPDVAAHLDDQEWIERHLRRVLNVFAAAGASVARLQRYFQRLLEECGVYWAEEMLLVAESELAHFDAAGLSGRTRFWAAPEEYEGLSRPSQERVYGIKLFADGALGARTAALHQPYRDQGGRGLLLYETAELARLLERYIGAGKPVAVHAIGDRALDQVVGVLEGLRRPTGGEVRIEHAQLISEATARRAKAAGIVLCMQPNFSEDSVNYAERLPVGYAERNNPFRMLIDEVGYQPGVDLLFGSDGMPPGWRYGLQQSLFPLGGFAGQVLTVEEFVAGYCLPDCGAGWIAAEIDWDERQVTGRVVLS